MLISFKVNSYVKIRRIPQKHAQMEGKVKKKKQIYSLSPFFLYTFVI